MSEHKWFVLPVLGTGAFWFIMALAYALVAMPWTDSYQNFKNFCWFGYILLQLVALLYLSGALRWWPRS